MCSVYIWIGSTTQKENADQEIPSSIKVTFRNIFKRDYLQRGKNKSFAFSFLKTMTHSIWPAFPNTGEILFVLVISSILPELDLVLLITPSRTAQAR